jgi:hypothetical protein
MKHFSATTDPLIRMKRLFTSKLIGISMPTWTSQVIGVMFCNVLHGETTLEKMTEEYYVHFYSVLREYAVMMMTIKRVASASHHFFFFFNARRKK